MEIRIPNLGEGADSGSVVSILVKEGEISPYLKQADLAIFEVDDYREIPYYFGVNKCRMTIKKGEIIFTSQGNSGRT